MKSAVAKSTFFMIFLVYDAKEIQRIFIRPLSPRKDVSFQTEIVFQNKIFKMDYIGYKGVFGPFGRGDKCYIFLTKCLCPK